MTTKRFLKTALILSGVAMIGLSSAAKAGFEWKGPLEPPAPAPAASGDTGGMSDLAPVTSTPAPQNNMAPPAQNMSAAPMQTMSAAPMQTMSAAPMQTMSAAPMQTMSAAPMQTMSAPPMQGMSAAPTQGMAAAPGPDALTGFASDVPLVMALQQIVPPGYQYSFASGVNPGTSVSWEGGKPWQGVLTDMLSRQGLAYALQSNTVVVGVAQGGPVSSPAQGQGQGQGMSPAPEAAPAPALPVTGSASPAPMNIISQPPAKSDQSAADAGMAGGMSAMPPAENAPQQPAAAGSTFQQPAVAGNAAPQAQADASAEKPKEVDIRRKKTGGSFFERLGFTHSHDSADRDSSSTASKEAPGQPAPQPPQKMAAADTQPPTMTDMSQPAATPAAQPASPPPQAAMSAMPADGATTAAAAQSPAGAWQGTKGQTLRDVLKAWSDKAGVDLYWSIDYDYRLSDDMTFPGSFDEAVGHLLDKFAAVRPQPYGQLHQGGQGPRVLVIKSYDVAQ